MSTPAGDFYYLPDGLGSTANLTSSTGTTEWSYSYEPYGPSRSQTKNDPSAPDNPVQYTGQYLDAGTGLYDLRARQYDPSIGGFLSPDPAPYGPAAPYQSAYGYGDANPTLYTDPTGMRAEGAGTSLYDPAGASTAEPTTDPALAGFSGNYADVAKACSPPSPISACWAATTAFMKYYWAQIRPALDAIGRAAIDMSGIEDAQRCLTTGAVGSCVVAGVAAAAIALPVLRAVDLGVAADAGIGAAESSAFGATADLLRPTAAPSLTFEAAAGAAEEIPTVVFSRSAAPGLARNFDEAVANGAPTRLNRASAAVRDANRRAALRGQQPAPAGMSLDEYPFACSAQGGAGACVSAVPVEEQRYQGGVLSSFFQRRGIGIGDPFDVSFAP